MLIDLFALQTKQYDQETGIVTVSPSVRGGQLNEYLKPFGVWFPGGHCHQGMPLALPLLPHLFNPYL